MTGHQGSAVEEAAPDGKEAVEEAKRHGPKTVLRLPDLDQAKSVVLNVVLRYRIHLESRHLAPGTINLRLGEVRATPKRILTVVC